MTASARKRRRVAEFAIAVATFYGDLAEQLVAGATEVFEGDGHSVHVHRVPGAY